MPVSDSILASVAVVAQKNDILRAHAGGQVNRTSSGVSALRLCWGHLDARNVAYAAVLLPSEAHGLGAHHRPPLSIHGIKHVCPWAQHERVIGDDYSPSVRVL